jgi:phosphotransferase system enzyme I (PtsI)
VIEISGIAASPGVVIGRAFVVHSESFRVFPRKLADDAIEGEIERFKKAIELSKKEILEIKRKFQETSKDPGLAEIFDTHIHLHEDVALIEETIERVRKQKTSVEFLFSETLEEIEEKFSAVEDEFFRQRWHDIQDVGSRILRKLLQKEKQSLNRLTDKVIAICHDLTPADTASMDRENVLAFATDVGGRTSHTAIMAKALEIPAVVGLTNVTKHVRNDDVIIVDGLTGVVIVAPDEQTLNEYKVRRERFVESELVLTEIKELPAQTLDGHTIGLAANIDLPEEIDSVLGHGAEGIGLFRTEFLYLNRAIPPSEDEQAEAYSRVAQLMSPNPVTIRTLDIGGDKVLGGNLQYQEDNPFMGCRAIRFCLDHLEIFKPQLRAILRASVHGRIRLMFPMITGLTELMRAKAVLEESQKELESEGIPFDPDMPVGVMIETPSAVLVADALARESDFFSIGTNDLIQYSLAIDRVNERVAHLYEPAHPGVLRMLKMIIEAADKAGLPLSICGEIAGDISLVLIIIGLGLKELSMAATTIPEVKKLIRSISLKDVEQVASRILDLSTAEEVKSEVQASLEKLVPNYGDFKLFGMRP